MTKVEIVLSLIEKHREMWNTIASETRRSKTKIHKKQYFKLKSIPFIQQPLNQCYACEAANVIDGKNCKNCPFQWGDNVHCTCIRLLDKSKITQIDFGYFEQWKRELDWENAADLAEKIANLPLKPHISRYLQGI